MHLALTAPAVAQRVNLDHAPAPQPGSGMAALALAEGLDKELADLAKLPSLSALQQAQGAIRRLSRDLLRLGEQEGSAGSVRVLVGRMLAAGRPALDDALLALGNEAVLGAIARDLSVPADALPAEPAALDRLLRDALAPLTQEAAIDMPVGWVRAGAPGAGAPAPLDEVARRSGLAREAEAAFVSLEERLKVAEGWRAYRAQAGSVRSLAGRAAEVWGLEKMEWLGDAALARLRRDLLEAAEALAKGDEAAEAVRTLRRLDAFAQAAQAVGVLESGRAGRAVRAAMGGAVTAESWATDIGLTQRLGALRRAARLLTDAPAPQDRAIARQLRPALRALEPAARQSGAQLLETLPRLLAQADAMSDPAVLGAVTAHERRLADLSLLVAISGVVSERGAAGEAVARPAMKPLADRLLALGQDLGRAETRDLALSELRALGEQVRDYGGFAGESRLRAGLGGAGPEWAALGDRIGELPDAIDQARQEWLAERTTPKVVPGPQKAERLALMRRAVRVLADAAGVRRAVEREDGGSLNAWPGWEASREALAAMSGGLFEKTSRLIDQVLAGQGGEAEASVEQISAQHGAALLWGRLEFEAADLPVRVQSSPVAALLSQVGLGPPDEEAWLVGPAPDLRADLAAICRYAEESAFAQAAKDNAAAQALRAYYNARAAAVLERLDAETRR